MPRSWETWGTRCSVLQLPSPEMAYAREELEQSMIRESQLGQMPENTGKTQPNSGGGEHRGNPVLAPRIRGETELEGKAPGLPTGHRLQCCRLNFWLATRKGINCSSSHYREAFSSAQSQGS